MFVVRTTEGLVLGLFSSYDIAKAWADRCIWADQIDDIFRVMAPRPDMLKPKERPAREDRPAVCYAR